jgi:hypothetical protein
MFGFDDCSNAAHVAPPQLALQESDTVRQVAHTLTACADNFAFKTFYALTSNGARDCHPANISHNHS